MISKRKIEKLNSPQIRAQREQLEQELRSIPKLDAQAKFMMSEAGFIDYYLRMTLFYPTQIEAYERLEDFYTEITGKRRYSEFKALARAINRYKAKLHKTAQRK